MICVAFLALNILVSLKTSLSLTTQKQKPGPFLAFLMAMIIGWFLYLKLVSAIFYQSFIFTPNASPSKTMKNVFYFI